MTGEERERAKERLYGAYIHMYTGYFRRVGNFILSYHTHDISIIVSLNFRTVLTL